MSPNPTIDRLNHLLEEARALAQNEHIMVRVTGEHIAVILVDLLYEIDPERPEVISLLPEQLREPGGCAACPALRGLP